MPFSNKNHWTMELIEKEWCKHPTVDRIFIWIWEITLLLESFWLEWKCLKNIYIYVYIYIHIFVKVTTLRLLASSDRQKNIGAFFTAAQSALVTCVMPNQGGKPGCKVRCQYYHSWIMSYHVQRLKAAASNDYKHIILVVYKSWKSFWPLAWRFEYRESVWEDVMISSSQ